VVITTVEAGIARTWVRWVVNPGRIPPVVPIGWPLASSVAIVWLVKARNDVVVVCHRVEDCAERGFAVGEGRCYTFRFVEPMCLLTMFVVAVCR
jgi:hypothetical protein